MSDFIQRFVPATVSGLPTVVLLHGTGGDESDLIRAGQLVAPGAALLGVRGNVLENGAPRFFRRLREGVFDLEDLRFRTNELADFLASRGEELLALGYSNGANIAASMLLLRPEVLSGAILFRAMFPLEPDSAPDLRGKHVFLASGLEDPIIPFNNAQRLAQTLESYGADMIWKKYNAGHALTNLDIEDARAWFSGLSPR